MFAYCSHDEAIAFHRADSNGPLWTSGHGCRVAPIEFGGQPLKPPEYWRDSVRLGFRAVGGLGGAGHDFPQAGPGLRWSSESSSRGRFASTSGSPSQRSICNPPIFDFSAHDALHRFWLAPSCSAFVLPLRKPNPTIMCSGVQSGAPNEEVWRTAHPP